MATQSGASQRKQLHLHGGWCKVTVCTLELWGRAILIPWPWIQSKLSAFLPAQQVDAIVLLVLSRGTDGSAGGLQVQRC